MAALLLLAASQGVAAGVSERIISVTGSASAVHDPDMVVIRFGVELQRETSGQALRDNASLMNAVVAALEDTGIGQDEISTSRFNIHAVYENQRNPSGGHARQVLTGYRVSNIITVQTASLDRVAAIIDGAVAAGVNRVEGVQFQLSPGVLAGLKDRLIGQAVLNARRRAELALEPLNQVITGVKTVQLSEFSPPVPMMADHGRLEMASSAPTQIFASDQEVRTSVQVTFLIGPESGSDPEQNP